MAQEDNSSLVGQFVKSIAIIVIVLVVACALVWWVADWTTLYQYGTALILAGILCVVVGFMGVMGGTRSTRSFNYQQAESVGYDTSGHDRVQESKQNFFELYEFLIVMGSAGCITVVVGLVIRLLA